MEHLQQRAAQEDLYGWSNLVGSDQFRSQLRDLETEFMMPDDLDCYDQPAASSGNLAERIAFIEDRLESCGSSNGCNSAAAPPDAGEGVEAVMRRMGTLQAELLRQRTVIRNMRLRLMSINRQLEGTPAIKETFSLTAH